MFKKIYKKSILVRRVLKGRGQFSYSQRGEDVIIKSFFDILNIKQPSYVDVGANDPYFFNNTQLFYDLGSRGINIEPNYEEYLKFEKKRKNDINLNIGIHDYYGEANYYLTENNALNTFSKTEAVKYEKEHNVRIKEVKKMKVETLNNIFEKYNNNKAPDILSVDVEGIDFEIISSINFMNFRPKIICVETLNLIGGNLWRSNTKIEDFLRHKQYNVFAFTGINTIFYDINCVNFKITYDNNND